MEKLFFFSFLIIVSFISEAQTNDHAEAIKLVTSNSTAIGLAADGSGEYMVSSSYLDKNTGIRMVYLIQRYNGLPVYNQMLVLAFRNDKLISKAGAFNQSIEKFVNVKTGIPSITAASAVQAALADRKLKATAISFVINRKENGRFVEFNDMGVSSEHITAELMWVPIEKTNQVKLAWQVYIIPTNSSDYWLVRMDAMDNSFLGVDNLTAYDNWSHPVAEKKSLDNNSVSKDKAESENTKQPLSDIKRSITTSWQVSNSPSIVNGATYRVVPFPAESPIHPGGTPALISNPWTTFPGNATSLKWHTGLAGADYNYTRGNNVWAYQDQGNTNAGTLAKSASSTTASDPLSFDFVPNFTVAPTQTTPVQNQQFNTTNLFYWNNIIHDIMYQYGFNEVTGNFQDDNQGRGGTGNDHVNAEAQDGSGTNNANFSTPVDGSSGRMQMYLWTGTPQLDGDVDNGIIIHEYGHGISTRLAGGPANSSCLNNSEQMGEGWSDYFALMFTQDWSAATLTTGFNSPRGIGTYALNQPITGAGIRPAKYCTDMTVNNYTYSNLPSMAIPHGVGFIWCTTLWDMTWNIINQVGAINPNIYDVAAGGGNVIAMRLVTEGIKLQQCSPGFISGRNAILQADQNLYGGAYHCAIISAFARRGMGTNASEGSTSSTSDQTVDFSGGAPAILLTQNGIVTMPEGQNIIYNNKVSAECSSISNYMLRDTLPSNVTFVSATNGGTYNAGNRVISWPVNLAAGAIGNYGFTVNINAGSYYPSVTLISEPVASTTIAASWSTASTTANVWTAHNTRSHSAPNSFFSPDAAVVSDQTIATTSSIALGATPPILSFWHWYNTESTFDGGVLEISTDGGTSWAGIAAANITQNGYNATISTAYSNPIGGRAAWSGNSGAFVESKVSLAAYANQPNVKLRWRLGTDNSVAATGWNVDDITLQEAPPAVNMRSSLFNNTGTRLSFSDTTTIITGPALSTLNLKVFLGGVYLGSSSMRSTLYDLSLDSDPTVTDNITVNLWSVGSLVNPNPDYTANAKLHSNGLATLQFPAVVNGKSYYIAVKHRSSIETWSKLPVAFTSTTAYDFSTGLNKAYDDGVNPPMAAMGDGVFAIYAGDVNQDGGIDASDLGNVDNDNSIFAFGYNDTDTNGDGGTDASDLAIVDNNSQLFLFYARPF